MASIDRFVVTRIPHSEAASDGGTAQTLLGVRTAWSLLGPSLARPRPWPARSSSGAWTQADVVAVMDRLYPLSAEQARDPSRVQRCLCLAFLAGAAESRDTLTLQPSAELVSASILTARALLKNRAARHPGRLWHAFVSGMQAARAEVHEATPAVEIAPLRLFIRQPFTESDAAQQKLIAGVLAQIDACSGGGRPIDYLTGRKAESAQTFKTSFESETGRSFTPQAFRAHRLDLLSQAQAFINIRVGMSESSAFELCYHIFKGACTPVLFLVWKHAPIKTTLLRELQDLCDITYLEFEHAHELRAGIADFFRRCERRAGAAPAPEPGRHIDAAPRSVAAA
jgi:hypothetical protein